MFFNFNMIDFLKKVRIILVRTFIPHASYYLFGIPTRSTLPLSDNFGYDRGKPIDRYYIEEFLRKHAKLITGRCLEIESTKYIEKYGTGVTRADALDINKANKDATIIADLRSMPEVESNTYDCLVLTSTYGMIDDLDRAVAECYRILKPGGTLLATLSAINRVEYPEANFWAFRSASAKYLFGKYFQHVNVESHGNVLVGQAFLVGQSLEDLTEEDLLFNDPHYPVVVTVVAKK